MSGYAFYIKMPENNLILFKDSVWVFFKKKIKEKFVLIKNNNILNKQITPSIFQHFVLTLFSITSLTENQTYIVQSPVHKQSVQP